MKEGNCSTMKTEARYENRKLFNLTTRKECENMKKQYTTNRSILGAVLLAILMIRFLIPFCSACAEGTGLYGYCRDDQVIFCWNEVEEADYYVYNFRTHLGAAYNAPGKTTYSTSFSVPAGLLGVEDGEDVKGWVGAKDAEGNIIAQDTVYVTYYGPKDPEPDECNHKYNKKGYCKWCGEECPHDASEIQVDTDTSYNIISETQHEKTRTYDVQCSICRKTLQEDLSITTIENHMLDENGDCVFCNYRTGCTHSSTEDSFDGPYYQPNSESTHIVSYIVSRVCANPLCGEVREWGYRTEKTEENHTFSGNRCILCGYTLAELSVFAGRDSASVFTGEQIGSTCYVEGGSGSYSYAWQVFRNGCLVRESADATGRWTINADETGTWSFEVFVTDRVTGQQISASSGTIEVLPAQCTHETQTDVLQDKEYRRFSDATHEAISTVSRFCNDCGGQVAGPWEESVIEEHVWSDGRCIFCDALASEPEPPCTHAETCETVIDSEYFNNGSDINHTVVLTYQDICAECGEIINTTRTSNKTELHRFDGLVCRDCGYVLPDTSAEEICDHADRRFENDNETFTPVNEECHLYSYNQHVICNNCGLEMENWHQESVRQPHSFDAEGICTLCGFVQLKTENETEDISALELAIDPVEETVPETEHVLENFAEQEIIFSSERNMVSDPVVETMPEPEPAQENIMEQAEVFGSEPNAVSSPVVESLPETELLLKNTAEQEEVFISEPDVVSDLVVEPVPESVPVTNDVTEQEEVFSSEQDAAIESVTSIVSESETVSENITAQEETTVPEQVKENVPESEPIQQPVIEPAATQTAEIIPQHTSDSKHASRPEASKQDTVGGNIPEVKQYDPSDGCKSGNHKWGDPSNVSGTIYMHQCVICGAKEQVEPGKEQFMKDMFDSYQVALQDNLFEENALNASVKLTDNGFVLLSNTTKVGSDLSGEIIDRVTGEYKSFSDVKTDQWEYMILNFLSAEAVNTTEEDQAILDTLTEGISLLDSCLNVLDNSASAATIKLVEEWKKNDALITEMNKTLEMYADRLSKLIGSEAGEVSNTYNKLYERLAAFTSKSNALLKVQNAMDKVSSILKFVPIVTMGVTTAAETRNYAEMQETYAGIAMDYSNSVERLESIRQFAKKGNNKELLEAVDRVYGKLNDRLNNISNSELINYGAYRTLINSGKAATNLFLGALAEEVPPVLVIQLVSGAADLALRWSTAMDDAIGLEVLGVMNAEIKHSISSLYNEDLDMAYAMNSLLNEIQIEGYEQTKKFLDSYEDAWGLSIEEFGYYRDHDGQWAEERYQDLFKRIDNRITMVKQSQDTMRNLYHSEWHAE